eukprot:707259-Rhodomonas_salina.4
MGTTDASGMSKGKGKVMTSTLAVVHMYAVTSAPSSCARGATERTKRLLDLAPCSVVFIALDLLTFLYYYLRVPAVGELGPQSLTQMQDLFLRCRSSFSGAPARSTRSSPATPSTLSSRHTIHAAYFNVRRHRPPRKQHAAITVPVHSEGGGSSEGDLAIVIKREPISLEPFRFVSQRVNSLQSAVSQSAALLYSRPLPTLLCPQHRFHGQNLPSGT